MSRNALYQGGADHAREFQENRANNASWDEAEGVSPEEAMAIRDRWQQENNSISDDFVSYWNGYLSRWD